jgi:peptide-methionine (S)-S-oxide reductase
MRTAGYWALLFILFFSTAAEGETTMLKKATFAGGCFWGMEKFFWDLEGVVSTRVGYTGGSTQDPSYDEVCSGRTGHAEAVEITYDPSKISYEKLLLVFWQYHDPTTLNRQGPDIGSQYRSAIFFHDQEQERAAKNDKGLLEKERVFKGPIVTQIVHATEFYPAENHHQKYLKKNPFGYCSHHFQSHRIAEVLGSQRK